MRWLLRSGGADDPHRLQRTRENGLGGSVREAQPPVWTADGLAGLVCLVVLGGLVLLAAWLGWQERRAQRGHEIHAHADRT